MMGEKVRNGGQLLRDSHWPLHEPSPPPQTLRGRCVPGRASTGKDDAGEIQSLAAGKAREKACEVKNGTRPPPAIASPVGRRILRLVSLQPPKAASPLS